MCAGQPVNNRLETGDRAIVCSHTKENHSLFPSGLNALGLRGNHCATELKADGQSLAPLPLLQSGNGSANTTGRSPKPLAIDLFTGLHGWGEGLVAEGYRVVGFDLEDMCGQFGVERHPGIQLVIQDVLTIHGRQFKDAALIVASPPCQAYSYRAMPWKHAKALPPPDNALFEACFRIQREACEAAGHHIPLVVENVCGAQKWVGRARWHYGSFYLWGDVPALMPLTRKVKVGGFRFDGSGGSFQTAATKVAGLNWSNFGKPDYRAKAFNTTAEQRLNSISNAADGCKQRGSGAAWWRGEVGSKSSKSSKRKQVSAMIAKIPLVLSRHIARAWA